MFMLCFFIQKRETMFMNPTDFTSRDKSIKIIDYSGVLGILLHFLEFGDLES